MPYLQVDQGVLLSLQTLARPASIADLRGMVALRAGLIHRRRPGHDHHPPGRCCSRREAATAVTRGLRNGRSQASLRRRRAAPSLATLRTQVPSRYGPLGGVHPHRGELRERLRRRAAACVARSTARRPP